MTDAGRPGPGGGGASGAGFLDFFILEASEYVEQLDGLLLSAGAAGPNAESMQRVARALRGTATMAKIPTFADLAAGVERVGRAMREGALHWDPALGGVLVAAIDDLRTLLRSARSWSPADDRRAQARSAELSRFAPARGTAPITAVPAPSSASAYLATEAANIAAGLELLTTHAADPETAANVLRRVRALRGVASVKEVTPLADALEAIEDAGRGLEVGDGALPSAAQRVLETAAAYLRTASSALRGGGDVNASTTARDAFEKAIEAWSATGGNRERVVPISELFYTDGGSGLIDASQHPPTTASERFRLEVVSLGEHLHQVIAAARSVPDAAAEPRVQRELRRAVQALESAAESFGEHDVAAFVRAHAPAPGRIDFLGLSALDDLAATLAAPGDQGQRLRARLRDLAGGREMASGIASGMRRTTPTGVPIAIEELAGGHGRAPGSSGRMTMPGAAESLDPAAAALIDSGIAALESFSAAPIAPGARIVEEDGPVVPIEALLYRGRAALDRAVEVRDSIRRNGPPTDPDALEELFDLLELARVE